MATGAGPAALTAAAAQQREGAEAAGSGPAAPPAGPAAFLSLPAPFGEEGTWRGAGSAAAAGPRPELRGERGLGGGGARGGAREGPARPGPAEPDARPALWGVLAVPVLSPGVGEAAGAGVPVPFCAPSVLRAGRAGPDRGGSSRPAPETASPRGRKDPWAAAARRSLPRGGRGSPGHAGGALAGAAFP